MAEDTSIIIKSALGGALKVVDLFEKKFESALAAKGEDRALAFPDTVYYLPIIYSLLGLKIEKLGELRKVLEKCRGLAEGGGGAPALDDALAAGRATVMAAEAIEAIKHLDDKPASGIWLGATSDSALRSQGVKLVDGTMPGIAVIIGGAPSTEKALKLIRDLQEHNILTCMAGETNGLSLAEQLAGAGVQMNWDSFLVPYGKELTAAVYALGVAVRVAMTFGNVAPGMGDGGEPIMKYCRERVNAFVLALGDIDETKCAVAAGVLNFGFPIITDAAVPQLQGAGDERRELIVSRVPYEKMAERGIEARGIKIRILKIPIPVRYGPAFEGERVRKPDMAVEFGGKNNRAFEYLYSVPASEIDRGDIELVGPDISDVPEGSSLPLAIIVKVAGLKMEKDFEPILERHVHHFLNQAMGVMHTGQRDMVWMRISKEAVKAGFRICHLGEILKAKLINEFPSIVDKVQVVIYTEKKGIKEWLPVARKAYDERDRRLKGLTDEGVETFYSCLLCQSFAPNHVCIITPERPGLCGAYNWLDGKASYEINPIGPNQPVRKGGVIDELKGKWKEINKFVYEKSNKTLSSFSAYSIMDDPMTSCGCFECIVAILPEANGFMVVNREYQGPTPSGMTFSALAEVVGGGQQTPGFIGIGTRYVLSKKFISADGGLKRIVWMTKEIKDRLGDELRARCEEIGEKGLLDKIADETIAKDPAELLEFLKKVDHPALKMEQLM